MSTISKEEQAILDQANATIREFFAEDDWHYKEDTSHLPLTRYNMGVNMDGASLRIHVYVDNDPLVCRIDAILPITADKLFAYPLCAAIVKENYPRRYGALHYDERDGEISYRYSFPITHGLHKEDFNTCLYAVASSASDSYELIRKCCVGRFKQSEVSDILSNVEKLVTELDD